MILEYLLSTVYRSVKMETTWQSVEAMIGVWVFMEGSKVRSSLILLFKGLKT